MNFIRVTSTAAAFLILGTMLPVYAQREGEKQEEKQARPQEQHSQQPQRAQRPAPQQRAAQPRQQEAQRPAQQARQTQPVRQQEQHARQAAPQPQHAQQQAQQPRQAMQAQPRKQEGQRAQQAQPQQRANATAQARQQPQRTEQQARSWQQQKGWAQQGGGSQGHATFVQDRSQNWSSDHRTWAQRGGYGGYYIPQDRFSVSFGSRHFFRLGVLPVMYMGYPRFSYGGFSFLLVDPWPGDWPGNWYSADDVYVDYDNGYYLYNRSYPQERLAITIAL